MAKIAFDIKFRPQIESGEYKVVLDCGVEAEILAWDKPGEYPIVCMAKKEGAIPFRTDNNGIAYHYPEGSNYSDLFIVTPEPELSEFENRIFKLLRQYKECDIPLTPENIKADASMLWSDFEKYFFDLYGRDGEGDSALRSFYYKGLADGKAEALKDLPRWRFELEDMEYVAYGIIGGGVASVENPRVYLNGHSIDLYSLRKLPGFKED